MQQIIVSAESLSLPPFALEKFANRKVLVKEVNEGILLSPVGAKQKIELGGWEGQIWMSDDFNEPMEEFEEYME